MSTIPLRKFADGVELPAIGFGVMSLGTEYAYGALPSDEERLKVLDAAYESGSTFWDTADVYGSSEELIGQWLKLNPEKRSKIFISTKFGLNFQDPNGVRGDPEYVKEQCNSSLKKMGIDYIDLYYQHRPDSRVPIEKTVSAMAELVKEGKVKYLGLSDCHPDVLRRAHAVHPISALQIEYSPINLETEKLPIDLIPLARSLGTKIIAYSPMGRGLLTGQFKSIEELDGTDYRRTVPRYTKENMSKILELADRIGEIGKKHNATSGQVTLAWVLSQGEDIFVIPGTKKVKYLLENVGAGQVKLTQSEINEVRKLAEETELPGDPYNAHGMRLMYANTVPL